MMGCKYEGGKLAIFNQFNGHYVSHYVSKNVVEQLLNFN